MERGKTSIADKRLQILADREEIRELVWRYAQFLFLQDWDSFANLFTVDALVDFSTGTRFLRPHRATSTEQTKHPNLVFQGRAGIRDIIPIAGKLEMKAFFTNHVIRVEGDHAKGISFFENRTIEDGESVIGAGRMVDEYTRVDGRWYISYRRQELFFFTGLREGWAQGPKPQPLNLRGWEEKFLTTFQNWTPTDE